MKSSSIFIGVLLAFGLLGAGCKSPTSVSSAPYVTISPSNLRQAEFVVDTFQARIFNHDLAQTYFGWNMGDSSVFTPVQCPTCNFQAIHNYTKPGTYAVTVNAFDLYSNTIITSTTTSVTIDTAKSTVEIIPQFYNGIQTMNNFGLTPFALSVKTSLPDNDLYQFWDFGDGTAASFISGPSHHTFPQPGSYIVKVDVYQKNGVYVGNDTAAITINWPDISPASLAAIKQMGRVEVFLMVDSSASIPPVFLPLSLALSFKAANTISGWNGNNFSVDYKTNLPLDFMMSGGLSNDGKKMDSLTFSTIDGPNYFHYGFKVSDLKLINVDTATFVFSIFGENLTKNLHIESFSAEDGSVQKIGPTDFWGNFLVRDDTGQPIPQCVLVFMKQ
jgi:PKD repeat protein